MSEVKTEQEIKDEAKKEFEREQEIKEQAKKELLDEQKKSEKKKNGVSSIIRLFFNIIFTLLFLFVLFETVMGVLDMQRINEDQEPIWYMDSKVETIEGGEQTVYNLGLYVIIKTKVNNEVKVVLKPFFFQ